jgi:peptidoglycan-associated lipoprotein
MRRMIMMFLAVSLCGVFAAGGCAKKKGASSAADSGAASATDASATKESNVGGGNADALAGSQVTGDDWTVYFGFNEYTIESGDRDKLAKAAEALKKGNAKVTIEGHCDERGSTEYNLALGERRAQSVKTYIQKLGVDGKALSTISYGKERPADAGHSEEAWAKNRRGAVVVNR